MAVEADGPLPLVLSVPDAGRLLMLGRSASYEAARRGDLPTIRLGRRLVVPVAQLEALLRAATPAGTSEWG